MAEIYTRFRDDEDIITSIQQTISSGMWSGGTGTLSSFCTSSVQSGSTGQYYYDVYKTDPASDSEAEIQFSVAYGHKGGSGSLGQTGNFPSKAIYSQYRNLLLSPNDNFFTFTPTTDVSSIYAISLTRARLREKIDPGNWELRLATAESSATSGSGKIKLIDDSGATTNPTVSEGGRVFNVVSGTIAGGTADTNTTAANETSHGAYGLVYPDMGLIILNANKLDAAISMSTGTASAGTDADNAGKMFDAIATGSYFVARREEKLNTTHFFCRITNKKYNFSTNPTFYTASTGAMTNPSFFKDPKVYLTTVGLYNDNNELLAVAKLSKPLLKSFSREAIIKVKLDF